MSLTPRRPSPTKTSSSSPTTTSVTTPSSMSDELRKRIIAFEEEQSRNEQQRQQLKGEAITPVQPIPQRYDVVGSERPEEEPLKVTIPSSVRKEYFFFFWFLGQDSNLRRQAPLPTKVQRFTIYGRDCPSNMDIQFNVLFLIFSLPRLVVFGMGRWRGSVT